MARWVNAFTSTFLFFPLAVFSFNTCLIHLVILCVWCAVYMRWCAATHSEAATPLSPPHWKPLILFVLYNEIITIFYVHYFFLLSCCDVLKSQIESLSCCCCYSLACFTSRRIATDRHVKFESFHGENERTKGITFLFQWLDSKLQNPPNFSQLFKNWV